MTIGRVVGRGVQAGLGLALAVIGLTWLNLVAASVLAAGGSCGSRGASGFAAPCPTGAWMAPLGIILGMAGLGLYLLRRPVGSPQLLLFAWPALFGSLGVQFLRAAMAEPNAYGFWLCGAVFVSMAGAPLVLVALDDRGAFRRALLGEDAPGLEPPVEEAPRIARAGADGSVIRLEPLGPVVVVDGVTGNGATVAGQPAPGGGGDDLATSLERLSRLHRIGDLSDAEYTEAKQKALDRA